MKQVEIFGTTWDVKVKRESLTFYSATGPMLFKITENGMFTRPTLLPVPLTKYHIEMAFYIMENYSKVRKQVR